MPEELEILKSRLNAARTEANDSFERLQKTRSALFFSQARTQLVERGAAQAPEAGVAARETQLARENFSEAVSDIRTKKENLALAMHEYVHAAPPQEMIRGFDAKTPVLLIPVRIETKFTGGRDARKLMIRVFPDDIAIETHEKRLSVVELESLKKYWQFLGKAGDQWNTEENKKAAWRFLCEVSSPERAAWLYAHRELMRPLNWNDMAARGPLPEDAELDPPAQFVNYDALPGWTNPPSEESWTAAPVTRVMPDRWVAHLRGRNGSSVDIPFINAVADVLPVGPDPNAQDLYSADELKAGGIDPECAWLTDFNKAVGCGMAASIDISEDQYNEGFSRLIVFGIKASLNKEEAQGRLESLFVNHIYTQGLSFVRQGTPTNNVPGFESGYSGTDAGYERSYAVIEQKESLPGSASANARLTPRLLGFGGAVSISDGAEPVNMFSMLENAFVDQEKNAENMAELLWPATWGYYLEQMMSGCTFSTDDVRHARTHFVANVRARGHLPAMRVGQNPYGILPVSSFKSWKMPPPVPRGEGRDPLAPARLLNSFISDLYPLWRSMAKDAPHVGRSKGRGDEDLLNDFTQTLSMLPASYAVNYRNLFGRYFMDALFDFYGIMDEATRRLWWSSHRARTRAMITALGYTKQEPVLQDMVYWKETEELPLALVTPAPLSETEELAKEVVLNSNPERKENYLEQLAKADLAYLSKGEAYINRDDSKNSILYMVARQSLLLEHINVSYKLLKQFANVQPGEELDKDVIGESAALGKSRILRPSREKIAGLDPEKPVISYVSEKSLLSEDELTPLQKEQIGDIWRVRDAIRELTHVPTAELERLCSETLDTASHRLDAWITSMFAQRLKGLRANGAASGVRLAGYAWVEDLEAEKGRRRSVSASGTEVLISPDNLGYVHAPSINHAASAAILRNAYQTHRTDINSGTMSVNLSSQRVSRAQWYLEGVRNGQPLGALLGYRFERALHEDPHGRELDRYIAPFRALCPLVSGKLTPENGSEESVAARNVVDGLALHRKWKENSIPFGNDGLPGIEDARVALESLDRDMDSLADSCLSESVYQAVLGNYMRAGAVMETIGAGGYSPELEVAKTPRGGKSLTHRVAVLFTGAAPLPDAAAGPRSQAEPRLSSWIKDIFGDTSNIYCGVKITVPGQPRRATESVGFSSLGISPLDFVYASQGGAGSSQESELGRLILYVLKQNMDIPAAASLEIDYSWKPEANARTFEDLAGLCAHFFDIVSRSRPLNANDLNMPEEARDKDIVSVSELFAGDNPVPGVVPLGRRAYSAFSALRAAVQGLEATLAGLPAEVGEGALAPDLASLREDMLKLFDFGIPQSVPVSASGNGADELALLAGQAGEIITAARKRMLAAEKKLAAAGIDAATGTAPSPLPEASLIDLKTALTGVFTEVFGKPFAVLPDFLATNPQEMRKVLVGGPGILEAGDDEAPNRWFGKLSRVKPRLARYESLMTYAEALNADCDGVKMNVAQLPYAPADRWLGLSVDPEAEITQGRLSIVAALPAGIQQEDVYAGILLDEWNEQIPNSEEVTGMAFHFNQPGVEAPQALLLAVHPDVMADKWEWGTMMEVLNETLDLAKIRAVDLDSLQGLNHYLPATCFADCTEADMSRTNFIERAKAAGYPV